jgi:hypothetical protein
MLRSRPAIILRASFGRALPLATAPAAASPTGSYMTTGGVLDYVNSILPKIYNESFLKQRI